MNRLPSRRAGAASLLALSFLFLAFVVPASGAERGPLRRSIVTEAVETEARVIVHFRADSALMKPQAVGAAPVLPQHAHALSARLGLDLTDGRVIGARSQVIKAKGLSSRDLAERMAAQSDVEFAFVDRRVRAFDVPNDTLYGPQLSPTPGPASGQWYLRPPTSSTIVTAASIVSAINAQAAWDITTGSSSVVIADLDTGIRKDHPDFAGKLLNGYDFIQNPATANDGDARDTDSSDPGDFVTQADVNVTPGCTQDDVTNNSTSSWHGTQTAGLMVAATNNGAGMASVGRGVMLSPIRVLGKCGGLDSDIQAAMLWAAGLSTVPVANPNPAKVINLSLGSSGACGSYQPIVNQVIAAGVVIVAAAGNDGLAVGTPANCTGVIAVAGLRHAGTKVGYSNLGPNVAISAPAGNCVNASGNCLFPLLTTSNSGSTTPVAGTGGAIYTNGTNDPSLGTSFSSPLVAGTVGLMLSVNPTLTPTQVLNFLKSSARTFPSNGAPPSVDDGTGVVHTASACTAPTSVAQSSECYCTTSTCGAGMLDAGAAVTAVAAAASATAHIAVASTSVVTGSTVTLDGSSSHAGVGANGTLTYQWAIVSGAAAFTSSTTASTATLVPSADGAVVVSLVVTDSLNGQGTGDVTLNASATGVTNPTTPVTPSSSDGGGGGAMQIEWLIGWLAAVFAVSAVTPRPKKATVRRRFSEGGSERE